MWQTRIQTNKLIGNDNARAENVRWVKFRARGVLMIGGSFALQKWFGLYLEGILRQKNAVAVGMWVQGGGANAIYMFPRNESSV